MKSPMKVFRMDDYDWVAAKSKEEAIEFYLKETGVSEDELDVKPCSLASDGMYTEISIDDAIDKLKRLANGERFDGSRVLKFTHGDAGLVMWVPFIEELEKRKDTEPFIICSTEF